MDHLADYSPETKSLMGGYRCYPNERKRFECVNCRCRFTQKTTITRHLRYFCGQGHRYQCPYCDMKASCSSNIYRHVRSRHVGYKAHAIKLFSTMNSRPGM